MRDGFFFEYEFVCVYVVNKRITFHKVELSISYFPWPLSIFSCWSRGQIVLLQCIVPPSPCYLYFCPVLNSNRINAELLGRTVRYDGRRPHQ